MKKKYKKIYCCGECVYYNLKKHECRIGAKEEGTARDNFYLDCPSKTFEEDEEEIGKKTTPRPVIFECTGYADGAPVYGYANCPDCGYSYEEGDKDWGEHFCPRCGQALNWEIQEEGDEE